MSGRKMRGASISSHSSSSGSPGSFVSAGATADFRPHKHAHAHHGHVRESGHHAAAHSHSRMPAASQQAFLCQISQQLLQHQDQQQHRHRPYTDSSRYSGGSCQWDFGRDAGGGQWDLGDGGMGAGQWVVGDSAVSDCNTSWRASGQAYGENNTTVMPAGTSWESLQSFIYPSLGKSGFQHVPRGGHAHMRRHGQHMHGEGSVSGYNKGMH